MPETQTIRGRPPTSFDVPNELTASESKLVYLFVAVSDGATVDDLHASLDMSKLTLFPVLETLSERGLVDHVDGEYVPASAS
ncbi:hypothetical protein SAMN04488065_0736 [Haloplanus vescus]|uniref:Sugar-specific transcriptional regulator TrmB n=1 Tax=Haloplanus vescus TaxID=555874 RepID=A0A1H3WDS4_9EURY|nr:hypothetical protein [Haloplanus vescus]SDZ84554.1 hypothetical protein SAMN04488065_0736 [Haloplanus vescus]